MEQKTFLEQVTDLLNGKTLVFPTGEQKKILKAEAFEDYDTLRFILTLEGEEEDFWMPDFNTEYKII